MTKAHNAITFDGGQGQVHNNNINEIDNFAAKGIITQFTTTTDYDLVTGDATVAYGGALTKAVRSMVFLRPNTLVVFDSLASATPRTWEWNIHALMPMIVKNARNIEIDQKSVRLCVHIISGPQVAFSQTDQFTVAPSGAYPNQWHGRFSSLVKSTVYFSITVLEVGCKWTPLTVEIVGGSRDVTVMGHIFNFDGDTVTVK